MSKDYRKLYIRSLWLINALKSALERECGSTMDEETEEVLEEARFVVAFEADEMR